MSRSTVKATEAGLRDAFARRGVEVESVNIRRFPDEVVAVVFVAADYDQAIRLASEVEDLLPDDHLVVVRRSEATATATRDSVRGVADSRVNRLVELLNERSRTSEQQPSLNFIKDAAENVRVAVTKRHHIVFGRRGVGKTALLLEAKRLVEESDSATVWQNMQVLRGLNAGAAFLSIIRRICDTVLVANEAKSRQTRSIRLAESLLEKIDSEFSAAADGTSRKISAIIQDSQQLNRAVCAETGGDIFIFIDDFHYLDMSEQPRFLDMLHASTRDCPVWIKLAGIRNQCRLFEFDNSVGMQVGHDVASISLDITLEEPAKARAFLSGVLQTYLSAAGITNRSGVFSNGALDRLVLACAGVPRDFLLLGARSVQLARERGNARTVGTQDVNDAAGEAGAQKLSELEEDAASARGKSKGRVAAFNILRQFAITERHCSFFRVSFDDKNQRSDEYSILQSLMDLRMIHIIKGSLSDAHTPGERSEVYLIDLSEYSGSRLRKNMTVIDLRGDNLVLRRTGLNGSVTVADTPRKLVQILRTGPQFDLAAFERLH
jgi:hypothetical protein